MGRGSRAEGWPVEEGGPRGKGLVGTRVRPVGWRGAGCTTPSISFLPEFIISQGKVAISHQGSVSKIKLQVILLASHHWDPRRHFAISAGGCRQTYFLSWGGWVHAHLRVSMPASVHTHTHRCETHTLLCSYTYTWSRAHSYPNTICVHSSTQGHTLPGRELRVQLPPIFWGQLLGFSELPFHVCPLDTLPLSRLCPHGYTHTTVDMDTGSHTW